MGIFQVKQQSFVVLFDLRLIVKYILLFPHYYNKAKQKWVIYRLNLGPSRFIQLLYDSKEFHMSPKVIRQEAA